MPDWAEPVVRYILEVGLPATLRVSAISVVGASVVGIVLGTVLTLDAALARIVTRGYVEVFRGLPILVTVFMPFRTGVNERPDPASIDSVAPCERA